MPILNTKKLLETNEAYRWFMLEMYTNNPLYYYFGAWTDLNNATPEELMPKCCDGSGGGSNTGTTKINNTITLNTNNTSGSWNLNATSQYPVASDVTATIEYSYVDSTNTTITGTTTMILVSGSKTIDQTLTIPNDATDVTITNATVSPASDDVYKYTTPPIIITTTLYYGVVPVNQSTITTTDITSMNNEVITSGDNEMIFNISAVDIDDDSMTDAEFQVAKEANAYDFIVAYDPNKVSSYTILDALGVADLTFINKGSVTVDGKNYTILRKSDPNALVNIYNSKYVSPQTMVFEYDFNMA
jgi:hypothetical protein